MLKTLSKILLYVSLVFLIIYLAKIDYLSLSYIKIEPIPFTISIILLFSGFVFSSLSWGYILKKHSIDIHKKDAIISHGSYIFAKYIPGKLWVVLGRAGHVTNMNNVSIKTTSVISIKEQLLYIFLGLLISFLPTYIIFGFDKLLLFVLLTIVALAVVLFPEKLHNYIIKKINSLLKRNIELPLIDIKSSFKVILFILIYWGLWSLAFYFLVLSLNNSIPIIVMFIFPISVVYGVLAIVSPGGIGVREAIFVLFFTKLGLNIELATTIAVVSRLWYILGEIFIFFLSLVLKKLH